jgi:hypothetical protein
MGGDLYVKYAHEKESSRPIDASTPSIVSPDLTLFPRAPDFFHELVTSPGQMEVSFAPAAKTDTSFRLEFFDKYLEWDRVALS